MDKFFNRRVLAVYRKVMDLPEGPTGKEYRRELRMKVRQQPQEYKDDVLSRADEIDESAREDFENRREIFLELGFTRQEAHVFARCRLNSPGIRTIVTERVNVTRFAKPDEIRMLNDGDAGVVHALKRLYIEGGIE